MIPVILLLALAVWAWPPSTRTGVEEGPVDPPEDVTVSTVEDVAQAAALLALAMHGGTSLTAALERVSELTRGQVRADLRTVLAAERWGMPAEDAWGSLAPVWTPAALAWRAAQRAGVPPSSLLVSAARRIRERESHEQQRRMQRAAVLLVLPLGGLFLPGFVATTVIPVMVELLGRS